MMRSGKLIRTALVFAALVAGSCSLFAQNPQLQTRNGRRFPTVIFSSAFWSANPPLYSIAVDATGAATYQSTQDSVERSGVPYTVEFQTSDATRRIAFNVVRELNLLDGDFPVSLGSPQISPVRTLAYHDITFNNHITYTDSTNSQIQELTSVFEEISATFEFARRVGYFHQHDRAGLEPELVRMQTSAERHQLRELQAVTPALKSVALDSTLSKSERAHAEALLALARKPAATPLFQSSLLGSQKVIGRKSITSSHAVFANVSADELDDLIHRSPRLEDGGDSDFF
jgi:hypothetical protein